MLRLATLSNEAISVVVAPELGGRVVELADRVKRRQWLWRNYGNPLSSVPPGSTYDDVWQGGFEELFPNDAPTELEGRPLPDHGELWSCPWEIEDFANDKIVLSMTGPVTGVRLHKAFEISGPKLFIRYRLSNHTDESLTYLFKLHAAFVVDSSCRIDIPGGFVEKVDPAFGNLLSATDLQPWPTEVNLAQCRDADSKTNEFVYVHEIREGWCGITDLASGSRVRIDYSVEVFPYCWIFMTYGGWRGHNVVVLEPCTNHPKDLQHARAAGTSASIVSGGVREFEVTISLLDRDDE